MTKEEIKEYLNRVEELEEKLDDEDLETLQWLIFGYNQCAKLLNETEQENKKYKKVIDKAIKHVSSLSSKGRDCRIYANVKKDILDILKEVKE